MNHDLVHVALRVPNNALQVRGRLLAARVSDLGFPAQVTLWMHTYMYIHMDRYMDIDMDMVWIWIWMDNIMRMCMRMYMCM